MPKLTANKITMTHSCTGAGSIDCLAAQLLLPTFAHKKKIITNAKQVIFFFFFAVQVQKQQRRYDGDIPGAEQSVKLCLKV